jgi:hypothetical protein
MYTFIKLWIWIYINAGVLNYHIDRADRISSGNSIEHRLLDGSIEKTDLFLKKGPITVGITSGASTPDRWVVRVHLRFLNTNAYVYICIYVWWYIFEYIHIFTPDSWGVWIYIWICIWIQMHIYIIYICVGWYVYIFNYIYGDMFTYLNIYIQLYSYVNIIYKYITGIWRMQ